MPFDRDRAQGNHVIVIIIIIISSSSSSGGGGGGGGGGTTTTTTSRVRNSGVRENFYFKPYLQKGVTCVFIFINSSTFFRPVVASKERQNFIYKQNRT